MPTCSSCGVENPAGFRFCGNCGAPLAQAAPERRKTATLLFCDVIGSTALGERLDPEAARELINVKRRMEEIIAEHTGQPYDRVSRDMERDYFLSAQEAEDYGIIDRVIAHR